MEVPDQVFFSFVEFLLFFIGATGCILLKVNSIQPNPYMDEIFHIPQAQKYCDGNFSQWDPMITTLPGLYLSSVGVAVPAKYLFQVPVTITCSTFWLRSINVFFAAGSSAILYLLFKEVTKNSKNYDPMKCLWNAATLSFFPVLYFFSFLYYTDPGSTFFTLLMYLLSKRDSHTLAASSGVVAILFRQTNIIWVIFVAGHLVAEKIVELIQPKKKDMKDEILQKVDFLFYLFNQLSRNWKLTIKLVRTIIDTTWSYILVGIGFAVFVYLNGSIVVGAKDDHQAGLHFPQIFYFSAFTGVFSLPHVLSIGKIVNFIKFICKHPIVIFLMGILCYFLIFKFTYAHRYLLADNRHYTFYIWSKIFMRHENVKFILIPGYMFMFWTMFDSLKNQNILWKLVFAICVLLNLVPSMLFELRYFIIPYFIFRLHIELPSYKHLFVESCLYILVNIATLYLFMFHPFTWPDDDGKQRFMW